MADPIIHIQAASPCRLAGMTLVLNNNFFPPQPALCGILAEEWTDSSEAALRNATCIECRKVWTARQL